MRFRHKKIGATRTRTFFAWTPYAFWHTVVWMEKISVVEVVEPQGETNEWVPIKLMLSDGTTMERGR